VATLIVRQVDDNLVQDLKERARRHGRSAEAEHRLILETALRGPVPSTSELLEFFRLGGELGLADLDLEGGIRSGPVEPIDLDN
jgi:plasmid stability protein